MGLTELTCFAEEAIIVGCGSGEVCDVTATCRLAYGNGSGRRRRNSPLCLCNDIGTIADLAVDKHERRCVRSNVTVIKSRATA